MIAVLAIDSNDIETNVSTHFARSPFLALVEKKNATWQIIENPFVNEYKGVGRRLVDYLNEEFRVDTIIAYELGVGVQKIACENDMQLIILNENKVQLRNILKLLKINI